MHDGNHAAHGRAQERIAHIAGRSPVPVLDEIGGHHFPTGHLREIETRLYALDDAIRALYLAVAEAGAQIDDLARRLDGGRAQTEFRAG
jgi:hypothetical protein